MVTGADALCAALAAMGCGTVWSLGASRIEGVLAAARRHRHLQVRGMSTELDATFAADGASRRYGIGVAAFIGSVGLTNAAAGVQTVVGEARPVLLLVGQTAPQTPFPSSQDTRLADLAVVRALGCAVWPIADNEDLAAAWPEVLAELNQSRPAALLVDEDALSHRWTSAPLPTMRFATSWPSRAVGANVPEHMDRAAIWDALAQAAPGAHAFADAGQVRLAAQNAVRDLYVHQCPATASLGWAIPAAMGASGTQRTFAVCGDGGFLMSLAAVANIGQHGLPVTIVVAENGILGVDAARSSPVPDDLRVPSIDYLRFAESVGVPAARAVSPRQVMDLCRRWSGAGLIVTRVPAFDVIPVLE